MVEKTKRPEEEGEAAHTRQVGLASGLTPKRRELETTTPSILRKDVSVLLDLLRKGDGKPVLDQDLLKFLSSFQGLNTKYLQQFLEGKLYMLDILDPDGAVKQKFRECALSFEQMGIKLYEFEGEARLRLINEQYLPQLPDLEKRLLRTATYSLEEALTLLASGNNNDFEKAKVIYDAVRQFVENNGKGTYYSFAAEAEGIKDYKEVAGRFYLVSSVAHYLAESAMKGDSYAEVQKRLVDTALKAEEFAYKTRLQFSPQVSSKDLSPEESHVVVRVNTLLASIQQLHESIETTLTSLETLNKEGEQNIKPEHKEEIKKYTLTAKEILEKKGDFNRSYSLYMQALLLYQFYLITDGNSVTPASVAALDHKFKDFNDGLFDVRSMDKTQKDQFEKLFGKGSIEVYMAHGLWAVVKELFYKSFQDTESAELLIKKNVTAILNGQKIPDSSERQISQAMKRIADFQTQASLFTTILERAHSVERIRDALDKLRKEGGKLVFDNYPFKDDSSLQKKYLEALKSADALLDNMRFDYSHLIVSLLSGKALTQEEILSNYYKEAKIQLVFESLVRVVELGSETHRFIDFYTKHKGVEGSTAVASLQIIGRRIADDYKTVIGEYLANISFILNKADSTEKDLGQFNSRNHDLEEIYLTRIRDESVADFNLRYAAALDFEKRILDEKRKFYDSADRTHDAVFGTGRGYKVKLSGGGNFHEYDNLRRSLVSAPFYLTLTKEITDDQRRTLELHRAYGASLYEEHSLSPYRAKSPPNDSYEQILHSYHPLDLVKLDKGLPSFNESYFWIKQFEKTVSLSRSYDSLIWLAYYQQLRVKLNTLPSDAELAPLKKEMQGLIQKMILDFTFLDSFLEASGNRIIKDKSIMLSLRKRLKSAVEDLGKIQARGDSRQSLADAFNLASRIAGVQHTSDGVRNTLVGEVLTSLETQRFSEVCAEIEARKSTWEKFRDGVAEHAPVILVGTTVVGAGVGFLVGGPPGAAAGAEMGFDAGAGFLLSTGVASAALDMYNLFEAMGGVDVAKVDRHSQGLLNDLFLMLPYKFKAVRAPSTIPIGKELLRTAGGRLLYRPLTQTELALQRKAVSSMMLLAASTRTTGIVYSGFKKGDVDEIELLKTLPYLAIGAGGLIKLSPGASMAPTLEGATGSLPRLQKVGRTTLDLLLKAGEAPGNLFTSSGLFGTYAFSVLFNAGGSRDAWTHFFDNPSLPALGAALETTSKGWDEFSQDMVYFDFYALGILKAGWQGLKRTRFNFFREMSPLGFYRESVARGSIPKVFNLIGSPVVDNVLVFLRRDIFELFYKARIRPLAESEVRTVLSKYYGVPLGFPGPLSTRTVREVTRLLNDGWALADTAIKDKAVFAALKRLSQESENSIPDISRAKLQAMRVPGWMRRAAWETLKLYVIASAIAGDKIVKEAGEKAIQDLFIPSKRLAIPKLVKVDRKPILVKFVQREVTLNERGEGEDKVEKTDTEPEESVISDTLPPQEKEGPEKVVPRKRPIVEVVRDELDKTRKLGAGRLNKAESETVYSFIRITFADLLEKHYSQTEEGDFKPKTVSSQESAFQDLARLFEKEFGLTKPINNMKDLIEVISKASDLKLKGMFLRHGVAENKVEGKIKLFRQSIYMLQLNDPKYAIK